MIWQKEVTLPPHPRGFHLITGLIEKHLDILPDIGILHVLIKHTSAGLSINENADPTVRNDLEDALNGLAPEGRQYTHDMEGPDDMPAHIKSSLVGSSLTIPITSGKMNLGAWQGIYLCEFRNRGGGRKLVLTVCS